MKWFKGNKVSNKNLSISGVVLIAFSLSLSMYLSKVPKQKVSKKHHIKTEQTVKKIAKKVMQPVAKKAIAKASVKKQKNINKMANYNLVKKSLKPKPRIVAYVGATKQRASAHLGMDGWNNQHEQLDIQSETLGDDPVGAAAFEKKRLQEELAASGL